MATGWQDVGMSEAGTLAHRLRRMSGRDPDEHGRASTPLELLFDLTFVVAVGQAANLFAHSVFEGHTWTGLIAFSIGVFAIIWAWINFSWFASAFDTDDWVFRVVTMVQMVGVCIVALGLPALFHSIDEGFCIIDVLFDPQGKAHDYRFLEANPAFERHTGFTNAVGRTIRELVPNHDAHWFAIYGRVASITDPFGATFEVGARPPSQHG